MGISMTFCYNKDNINLHSHNNEINYTMHSYHVHLNKVAQISTPTYRWVVVHGYCTRECPILAAAATYIHKSQKCRFH